MNENKKILICYNEPAKLYSNYLGKNISSDEDDVDTSETEITEHITEIISGLQKHFENIDVLAINLNFEQAIKKIQKLNPSIIFNLVESVNGISNYEAYIAGLYELMNINYTGNIPVCLGTCLNKERTKQILLSYGVRTPNFFIAHLNETVEEEKFHLKCPVILKLLNEDASIGISELSVVNSFEEVKARLKFLFKTYRQDVIIEEYINGREFNVSVLGGRVLPVSEINFSGLPKEYPKIVTYEGKWAPKSIYFKNTVPVCPAEIENILKEKLEKTALLAYEVLNCRDYARVDMRVRNNVPYVIEVNPNPDISSDAGLARAAGAAGLTYSDLLCQIAGFALERRKYDTKIKI